MVTRPVYEIIEDLSITTRILGLNITGSKAIAVYGDMNGLVYERMQMEMPTGATFLEGFDAICMMVDKLLKVCRVQGLSSPEVISLAISGPVNLLKGIVQTPPDLPTWEDAQIKGRLAVRYNLPVFIEHRSQAAALAEAYFGAGIGLENLVFLDMEPVVSLGLVLNERLFHGSNDAAGEIGNMRMAAEGPSGLGLPGSLTGFASGLGMAELAGLRHPDRWPTPPGPYELVQAVHAGEKAALDVVGESAAHLSKALAWVIAMLDPDIVVFGHPGDVLGESLLVPLREALTASGIKAGRMPRLVGAKLSAKLDDVAALMAVIDRFRNRD
jgi:glucokinase